MRTQSAQILLQNRSVLIVMNTTPITKQTGHSIWQLNCAIRINRIEKLKIFHKNQAKIQQPEAEANVMEEE